MSVGTLATVSECLGGEWSFESREVKARTELDVYRAAVDLIGYHPLLINYAIETHLKYTGLLAAISFTCLDSHFVLLFRF